VIINLPVKLIKYLAIIFIMLNTLALNGQELKHKNQKKPLVINADLFRLACYDSEKSIHVGISKSKILMGIWDINLEFYNNKSNSQYDTNNSMLDLEIVYRGRIPKPELKEFYVAGGTVLRNLYLVGYPGENRLFGPPIIYSYEEKAIYKFGIGQSLSLGMKISNNLFIENSVKFGIYIIGKRDQFYSSKINLNSDQDGLFFFHLDILKLGYKFGDLSTPMSITQDDDLKLGLSVNLYRLLKSMTQPDSYSGKSFSLSFSTCLTKHNLEFEVPIYHKNYENAVSKLAEDDIEPGIREVNHIGIHLKKYFMGYELRTYLSGFVRYCHLRGELDTDNNYTTPLQERDIVKIAIGLRAGYKHFFNDNWYLDFFLQAGRYVIGENDVFPSSDFDDINDNDYIQEIGSLKVGYQFSI